MENKKYIPLEIESIEEDKVIICTIKWEADNTNIDWVFDKINWDIENHNKIILNLSELVFCNSKFLWNLFFLADTVEKKWWKLCILECNSLIIESLSVVWIFDIIPMFTEKKEALNFLQ